MPAGFKKKRYGDAGRASEVGRPNSSGKADSVSHDGRANPRGGANYEKGHGERDFSERIYRDRRN